MKTESQNLQYLLERVAALLRGERRNLLGEHGLLPIQFEALYFLGVCNRYSDTPMAVTEYLGQTKGTVSQTLKVLEKKGLIAKQKDETDKRLIHLNLTDAGRGLLEQHSHSALLQHLPDTQLAPLCEGLAQLLIQMQRANGSRPFGQCRQCRFNQHLGGEAYFCNLTKEPLSESDTGLICREFESW
ncbi:MarR family winged helix-turn-helix transcriptional regulator [Shewanella cyperi]|uniref:MarR family winged helix-turn-helix transcriptional regulator n=1 Tax=Shewanella cyperi TaxID=2814292 RepID=UPI001A93EE47|nr:MarR family winged helix-turn-helix transcriptional regulator [Shewanella cyperi]QSX39342.1 winged helix-turn-helix transcriptional regulator [Shewanella cyperi]